MLAARMWPGPGLSQLAFALGLSLVACGSRQDSELFSQQQVLPGQGGAGQGGNGSGGEVVIVGGSGGTFSVAGSAGSAGSAGETSGGAGSGGAAGSGGEANGGTFGIGGSAGDGGSSGSGGSFNVDCSGVGGVPFEESGHCYELHEDPAAWAEARDHCLGDGGYLVVVNSEGENAFIWSLLPDRKWLGATDGRSPTQPGAGEYAWVTNEAMTYDNWSDGQPNAAAQDCPPQPGPNPMACFEHCMYQWNPDGFDNEGEWNDQGCWAAEAFICEFE